MPARRPVMEHYHRQWLEDGLVEGRLPDHGCISFLRLPHVADTPAFADQLCRERGIAVAPGEYFGSPGRIRIGFGKSAALLERGLDLMTAELVRSTEAVAD